MYIFFNGREHAFRVIEGLFMKFIIILGILKFRVVSLSDDHEQVLEVFLL